MKVKIKKLTEKAVIPVWNNKSAGCDLSSTEFYELKPGERKFFSTGLSIEIPSGLYGRVAPRSGLAYKHGIDVLAGVIDEDYRGDIGVILINLGTETTAIFAGDKIAQLIFENYTRVDFDEVKDLTKTSRGAGGFGSTDSSPRLDAGFKLLGLTTVDRMVSVLDVAISIKSHFRNFSGDIYAYEEGGHIGLCVVDESGTVQIKYKL
jgi:dUTP pyrophosphatase